MTDRYRNFDELRRGEREDVDFRVRIARRDSAVAIIAPHGGKIEFMTSRIAEAVAGDRYSFYAFEAMKPDHNRDLHITSAAFDEPQCLALVESCDVVVAMHGWSDPGRRVYLGGRDRALRDRIGAALREDGFETRSGGMPGLDGEDPRNICNRGRRRQGAQLEMSLGLRDELFASERLGPRAAFPRFVAAVQRGIAANGIQ